MARTDLITGATGFIGSAIALRLLGNPNDRVIGVVRGPDLSQARRKLERALRDAAASCDRELPAGAFDRLQPVLWDLTEPAPEPRAIGTIDRVWHAAGSMRTEEQFRDELQASNVEATRRAFDFARAVGASSFSLVGDAMSAAGGVEGPPIPERPCEPRSDADPYHRTKLEAEHFLTQRTSGPIVNIFRCAMAVGHLHPRGVFERKGFGRFLHELRQLKDLMSNQHMGSFLAHRPINLRANAEAEVNALPVDVLADAMVRIEQSQTNGAIFHLTNQTPPTVREVFSALFAAMGWCRPNFGVPPTHFTTIDEHLDTAWAVYRSAWSQRVAFDSSNTSQALGQALAHRIVLPSEPTVAKQVAPT